ncbi:hypothetical protein MNBD_BACTEROID05-947 [hydrothermal vent metagenome]|uniref:Late competence protein ComEA, DNA receptor n=1 Tax=hydrothermal vent metagenome TaxID=652676 RepID=A0A3B0U494_9ZZZZ
MFPFTKQEQTILFCLALVILSGSLLNLINKKYPALNNIINVIDSDIIYSKVDINRANVSDLTQIPYIGTYTARNIVEYRQQNGLFKSVDQILMVKGIRAKNFKRFSKHLKL